MLDLLQFIEFLSEQVDTLTEDELCVPSAVATAP
jgi:hypothetical protein